LYILPGQSYVRNAQHYDDAENKRGDGNVYDNYFCLSIVERAHYAEHEQHDREYYRDKPQPVAQVVRVGALLLNASPSSYFASASA
jgi:hypothetical protein